MAPYKLEDNIREKLEARELKPSADAWKKLEAKLDAEQPKRKNFFWYYAAASFAGLLIVASIFFSRNTPEINNQVVNKNIEQPKVEDNSEIVPQTINKVEIASEEKKNDKNTSENQQENKQTPRSNKSQLLPQPNGAKKSAVEKKIEKTDAIAEQTEVKQPINVEKPVPSEEDRIFNTKVNEVVASVKKLQENNTEVTATEVEALLNSARRDIQTQRILSSPKVDATALLQDVEWELEKSFRDKVFDALGEGFNKIRTAVSERND
ncbi:MAG: hypothetical protein CL530_09435 [Aequorivita sp.]|nr:hypothetical protein [Aequorivita sp.]|tara:strand:- start:41420 stop:42214 length:795 start_codon:yes stop_codon:yes gene_type:complete